MVWQVVDQRVRPYSQSKLKPAGSRKIVLFQWSHLLLSKGLNEQAFQLAKDLNLSQKSV